MSDVSKYLALREGSKTKPNDSLAGFGLSAAVSSGGGPAPIEITPGDILGTTPSVWADAQAASTVVDAGSSLCSAWAMRLGGSVLTFAPGARPLIIPAGSPNGKQTIRASTSVVGVATYQSPVPGTTSTYFWAVLKCTSIANSRIVNFGAAADQAVFNGSGVLRDYCGTLGPATPALTNAFVFVDCWRSNNASNYIAVNLIAGSLGNAGNGAASSNVIALNADPGGTNGGNSEFCEFGIAAMGDPGSTKRQALYDLMKAKWGVS